MIDERTRLAGEKYINLRTFRKNGEAVSTPVWFAEEDGKIYTRTFEKTGKVKRLRRDARVRVVPSDARGEPKGEWVEASARIVDAGSAEANHANRLLNQKYGPTKRVTELLFGLKYGKVVTVAVQIP